MGDISDFTGDEDAISWTNHTYPFLVNQLESEYEDDNQSAMNEIYRRYKLAQNTIVPGLHQFEEEDID